MLDHPRPQLNIVVPADHPPMMQGSPHLKRLEPHGRVTLYTDRPQTLDQMVKRARDADILINSRSAVTWPAEALRQLPRLRMIVTCSIGTDAIDLNAAAQMGITVCNLPGRTAPIVAEHAFGLMLAVAKRAAFMTEALKNGQWPRIDNIYLAGKTLGVVGAGPIGAHMIRLGRAIGMKVVAWTYHPSDERANALGVRFASLDELLETADVVSLHVKLTDESRHMVGRRQLARMKRGALLINCARGPTVDANALAEALDTGHLAGAGIDVYDQEPPPPDDPLLACQHVVLTPHCADMTPEGVDRLNAGAVENILAFLAGRAENVVA